MLTVKQGAFIALLIFPGMLILSSKGYSMPGMSSGLVAPQTLTTTQWNVSFVTLMSTVLVNAASTVSTTGLTTVTSGGVTVTSSVTTISTSSVTASAFTCVTGGSCETDSVGVLNNFQSGGAIANPGAVRIVALSSGTLQSVGIQLTNLYSQPGTMRLAVYTDVPGQIQLPNGSYYTSQPGTLLAQTNDVVPVVGWQDVPLTSSASVSQGSGYWLAVEWSAPWGYPSENHDEPLVAGTFSYGAFPSTFPAKPTSSGSYTYTMRMTYTTGGLQFVGVVGRLPKINLIQLGQQQGYLFSADGGVSGVFVQEWMVWVAVAVTFISLSVLAFYREH